MPRTLISVEAFHLRVPLGRPLRLGEMRISEREYVFVRLTDSEGHVGTALGHARSAPVAAVVERCVAPFWEGQPLELHEAHYAKCVKANVCLGTHGLFWRALSLVDCALYDLLARSAGQSLGDYLGGSRRAVPATIVGGYPTTDETPESLQAEMNTYAKYAPAGVKIASSADLRRDTVRLKACRERLPEDIPLMIDCYWSFDSAKDVVAEARKWQDFNMGWIEDPLAFDDYSGIKQLVEALGFPVAVGDEQSGLRAFERLLRTGLQVLRLDATVCGGVRAFMKIAAKAHAAGIPIACHVFHPLHAQLAAACPAVRWLETMLPESDIEDFHPLHPDSLTWDSGALIAPSTAQGANYDWYPESIERYRAT